MVGVLAPVLALGVLLSGCAGLSVDRAIGNAPSVIDRDGPPLREVDVANKPERPPPLRRE